MDVLRRSRLEWHCFLWMIVGLSGVYGAESEGFLVDTAELDELLRGPFGRIRNHLQHEEGKDAAREYIRTFAEEGTFDLVEQRYEKVIDGRTTAESSEETGINFILTLRGKMWNSSDDRPLVIGAHYDTREDTPGVDDNGSGMSALLAAAGYIDDYLSDNDKVLKYTLMFVAFDFEETADIGDEFGICLGSRVFVDEHLVPNVLDEYGIPHDNFQGAVVMETLMNWDDTEDSQLLPEGVQQISPDQYQEWLDGGSRGNFLSIASRRDDSALVNSFMEHWTDSPHSDEYDDWDIELPFSGRPSDLPPEQYYAFSDFFRSDHYRFWDHGQGAGLKSIMLTDTAEFRGSMQQCYHNPCDDVDAISDEKLQFLAKTTDALINMALGATGPATSGGDKQTICYTFLLTSLVITWTFSID